MTFFGISLITSFLFLHKAKESLFPDSLRNLLLTYPLHYSHIEMAFLAISLKNNVDFSTYSLEIRWLFKILPCFFK